MDFTLTSDGEVKYSPGERRIFRLLLKEPRSSAMIARLFYGMALEKAPIHARKIVIGLLTSLMKKTERNKEQFRICKTQRSGPLPMCFWIEGKTHGKAKRELQSASAQRTKKAA